jgi:aminocarboxymuconate-semialdehyde decarboxylase
VSNSSCVVDVHTHVVPSTVPELDDQWWPQADLRADGTRTLLFRGGNRRKVDVVACDMSARLEDMAARGVDAQVLSVMPALSADLLTDPEAALQAATHVNDFLEQCVVEGAGHFQAWGTIPLSSPNCLEEVDRRLDGGRFSGFQVTTTGLARVLSLGLWGDIAERAAARDTWIFIHPHDESVAAAWSLERRLAVSGFGMTAHTAVSALSLMEQMHASVRPPRVLLAHGGGALPYSLPRLDRLWESTPARAELPETPSALARRLFYVDTAVHGERSLALAVAAMPEDRCLFGTDYPFAIQLEPDDVRGLALDERALRLVMGGNAREYGLASDPSSPHQHGRARGGACA